MVRNKARLHKFTVGLLSKERIPHKKAIRIYEALHREAVSMGVISSANILEGIEVTIRIAKALNGLRYDRKIN
jgi:hypothetical protein